MPRPILKRSTPPPPLALEPAFPFPESSLRHVNFPDSSQLCVTHDVHSPGSYDRSPIVVDANSCALPERGCPGRTYEPSLVRRGGSAKAVYPRALRQQQDHSAGPRQQAFQHQLVGPTFDPHPSCPDLCSSSSESDESSDGFASPPPELWSYPSNESSPSSSPVPSYFSSWSPLTDSVSSTPTQDRPLSFLPHPNPHSPSQEEIARPCPPTPPERRRRSRISDEDAATIKTPKKKKSPSLVRAMAHLSVSASGGAGDDGCLGGF